MADLKFSIVIPIYNEEENIPELYSRLTHALKELGSYEIIFVDDGSTDRSFPLLKEIAGNDRSVKLMKFSRNFGQHPAINAGFLQASGEYMVLMDADLQDDPADIKKLYDEIKEGYDIVFTQIENSETSLFKKFNSLIFHFIFARLSGANTPPNIGTFRMFTRKVLRSINRYHERRIVFGPLMAFVGFSRTYLKVRKNKRTKGVTNYSFLKLFQMAIDSLSTYTMVPLSFMIYSGFFIASMSFAIAMYFIVKKITLGIAVSGYASIIIAIFFLSGVILLSLGIVGDYIFRIYQEVLNRPRFLIDETLNIDDPQGEFDEKA
ncbi:MAG: glycosyltransferase family 2 protein [Nitrospirae bacterium]|nr:glycosyltransferase family 2 protein [Nitrospirota bacterium]